MSANVFCFASAKGGSGKTVTAACLGSLLTAAGLKCLIIDCDVATHGMTLLYIEEVSAVVGLKKGLFDLESSELTSEYIANSVVRVENGVFLLPATYRFKAQSEPEPAKDDEVLQAVVDTVRFDYDVIILDAQAGSDAYSRLAMSRAISDEVVIVSEYDPLSAAGVERLKLALGDDLGYERTWILLNKLLEEFAGQFDDFPTVTRYLPPLPWTAQVVRAYAQRRLALDLENGSEFTLAIMRTAEALVDASKKEAIESWRQDRTDALRAPVEEQWNDATRQLDAARTARRSHQRTHGRRAFVSTIAISATAALMSLQLLVVSSDGPGSTSDEYVGIAVLVGVVAVFWSLARYFSGDYTEQLVAYNSAISTLEETERQLGALRTADLATLVKNKQVSTDADGAKEP